jgi:hypothetical protein
VCDFNRDKKVGPTDAVIARNHGTNSQTALKLISLVLNASPTVDAGPDDSIALPTNSVSLDGTASDDGLPNPPGVLITTWSKVSGPGTVTFADASALDTTATFSAAGVYVLKLEVNDGQYAVSDTIQITVTDPSGILLEDNFDDNNISDWTVVAGTGWAGSGGQATKLADDTVMAAIKKGGFSVDSGTISLEFDLTVPGAWRPGNAGLVDATGKGVYLDTYVGDGYIQIGARYTTDNALTGSGGNVVDASCNPGLGLTIRYDINLDTGQVLGYIDDDLRNTTTLDLSGVGPITYVVFQAKKQWYLDNVVLSGE